MQAPMRVTGAEQCRCKLLDGHGMMDDAGRHTGAVPMRDSTACAGPLACCVPGGWLAAPPTLLSKSCDHRSEARPAPVRLNYVLVRETKPSAAQRRAVQVLSGRSHTCTASEGALETPLGSYTSTRSGSWALCGLKLRELARATPVGPPPYVQSAPLACPPRPEGLLIWRFEGAQNARQRMRERRNSPAVQAAGSAASPECAHWGALGGRGK